MKFIELTDSLFLGKGGERSSYLHPEDNTKIIKVLFSDKKHNYQNELDFTYLNYLNDKGVDFSHITKCFGWVDTISFNSFSVKILAEVTILSFFLNSGY